MFKHLFKQHLVSIVPHLRWLDIGRLGTGGKTPPMLPRVLHA
jgi:hypothetical protein